MMGAQIGVPIAAMQEFPQGEAGRGPMGPFALPSVWDLKADVDWLVTGMLPLAGVTLLTAASGTGKTWLAYAIAGAVAHGTAFIGCDAQRRPVLYIDGENPLAIVKRDLADLGIARTNDLQVWGGWHDDPRRR